jgi:uncharacterized glyoxalase superfamily protein PhnB
MSKVKGIPDNSSVVIQDWCAKTRRLRSASAPAHSVRSSSAKGQVLIPAQNQFWGDRIAWIMDPSGHVWTVATRIEETTEQERTDRWSDILSDNSDT